ncbi:transcriptional regulator, TetR family [Desulfosarcina variabilis str. Montpellier]|uniref:TetR/AcrR family transcriptional regulator n=1 Tax=Desulfosarcina variabilis TaxID=2300 RepID=UPI003AFB72F9
MARIVKKPDERRKEILQAARELFKTKEYEKVTMQELMDKLNIAKGTIYHYFSSKDDLLESVVEDLIDEELKRKKQLLKSRRCRNLNALEKFRVLVTSDTMAEKNEEILESLHHPGNTLIHTRQLGDYLIKLAPIFAAVIEEGCDQGVFKTEHPRECAEFMLAGFQFLTDVGFYPWSQSQLSRRIKAFPSLIEAQLGAPKGSFSFLAE